MSTYSYSFLDHFLEHGISHGSLLVNESQLILSFHYFSYDQVWTYMLAAREWAQFGRKRQTLRVSQPQGLQRTEHFFTILPYKFAIPLQTTSVLLHWLLSRSLFLARLDVCGCEPSVNNAPSTINTVGYSLMPLVFLTLLWGILLIAARATGVFTKLKSPMAIVHGTSLAVAAACHPRASGMDTSLRSLIWGVVDLQEGNGMKHCSFSAEEVHSHELLPLEDIPRHWRGGRGKRTMTELAYSFGPLYAIILLVLAHALQRLAYERDDNTSPYFLGYLEASVAPLAA